jgi:hypothetical protein
MILKKNQSMERLIKREPQFVQRLIRSFLVIAWKSEKGLYWTQMSTLFWSPNISISAVSSLIQMRLLSCLANVSCIDIL